MADKVKTGKTVLVGTDDWEAEKHYYPRVLNASLHPLVQSFLSLNKERMANRYCHLHPEANKEKLLEVLSYSPRDFCWAGADLFCVTNEMAQRQMIVIETNSCPSGQKSMPMSTNENDTPETTQYYKMLSDTFMPLISSKEKDGSLPQGIYAVIYDKNPMEASGYAACLANLVKESIVLVEFYKTDKTPPARWTPEGVLEVRVSKEDAKQLKFDEAWKKPDPTSDERIWLPVKACFRYVTIAPWDRIPVVTKTLVLNPIVSCLAGGRNKLVASKAYEFKNAELTDYGLAIRTPETITDVSLTEVPLYLRSMGHCAVVKVPYSNAGQGVYTITSKAEMDEFLALDHQYDQFVVQSLVGNTNWSSKSTKGGLTYYHVGTIPSVKNKTYCADIRMMISGTENGFRPLAIYARRAGAPLTENLEPNQNSWDMLGTNLSILNPDGSWSSDTSRLMLMDRKDFNKLGISIDDLIDGFIQTVLAATAIDQMCKKLLRNGKFEALLFSSLNKDPAFVSEMCKCPETVEKDAEATPEG